LNTSVPIVKNVSSIWTSLCTWVNGFRVGIFFQCVVNVTRSFNESYHV